jgi:hypothetical protein
MVVIARIQSYLAVTGGAILTTSGWITVLEEQDEQCPAPRVRFCTLLPAGACYASQKNFLEWVHRESVGDLFALSDHWIQLYEMVNDQQAFSVARGSRLPSFGGLAVLGLPPFFSTTGEKPFACPPMAIAP